MMAIPEIDYAVTIKERKGDWHQITLSGLIEMIKNARNHAMITGMKNDLNLGPFGGHTGIFVTYDVTIDGRKFETKSCIEAYDAAKTFILGGRV